MSIKNELAYKNLDIQELTNEQLATLGKEIDAERKKRLKQMKTIF